MAEAQVILPLSFAMILGALFRLDLGILPMAVAGIDVDAVMAGRCGL